MIWKSEPHYQHQNADVRCYKTVKRLANTIIDRICNPAYTCILSLIYVFFLLNHAHASFIDGKPIINYTVSTSDSSPLLCSHFWKPVYYKVDEYDFPSHIT